MYFIAHRKKTHLSRIAHTCLGWFGLVLRTFASEHRRRRFYKILEDHAHDRRKLLYKLMPRTAKPKIGILGAPLVYGQPLAGACAAPMLLRGSRLVDRLQKLGAKVEDYGDLAFEVVKADVEIVPGCKYARTVGKANQQIAEVVSDYLRNGRKCLVLGGDHSIGLGSVSGHARIRENLAVIWVDAHADINTPLTSVSGNLHGMPVGFLIKELPHIFPPVPGMEWCKPCISAQQIAYIGLRSIDPGEMHFIRELDICAFTVDDIRQHGIDFVVQSALTRINPDFKRPIHLSFDVDALDPSHIPATGTPVPGGLTLKEALKIAQLVHKTGQLSVMDVVELNPMLSSKTLANWSADVAVEIIIRAFCGKVRRTVVEGIDHHK